MLGRAQIITTWLNKEETFGSLVVFLSLSFYRLIYHVNYISIFSFMSFFLGGGGHHGLFTGIHYNLILLFT